MLYDATTVDEYIAQLPEERKTAIELLRATIQKNIPEGFQEGMNYKMIGYFVPHSIYPDGYHCNPKDPLPFINIASQKNSVNLYHMGIYAVPEVHSWFLKEYPKHCKTKLDMGKSCIRFKKLDQIPYDLIGELASKITVNEWINTYKTHIKR